MAGRRSLLLAAAFLWVGSCSVYTEELLLPDGSGGNVAMATGTGGMGGAGGSEGGASSKAENGEACGTATECQSGLCIDEVCCNADCDGQCASCALSGTMGTCTLVPEGEDPASECGDDVCNGAGICRCKDQVNNGSETDIDCGGGICDLCDLGDSCMGPSDCVSNTCVNGTCLSPSCGDGIVQAEFGETCDDGNANNNDDCPDGVIGTCKSAMCGDGFTHDQESGTESCDGDGLGNAGETASCDVDCTMASCGDGTINTAAGEVCDDGNQDNSDNCPDGALGTCKAAICGDSFVYTGTEDCDDGNTDAFDACSPSCEPEVDHLLISEVVVAQNADEFIEIYNPTAQTVDLGDVWLADFKTYYLITTASETVVASDFLGHFPAGATIAAGDFVTVSMGTAVEFQGQYGFPPDYALSTFEGGTIGSQASLTNNGEMVVLFKWDGSSELVQDLDYVLFGNSNSVAMDKSGVMVGTSTYANDTPSVGQLPAQAPAENKSIHRCDTSESSETKTAGNGVSGHDETSENGTTAWKLSGAPSPGLAPAAGFCP